MRVPLCPHCSKPLAILRYGVAFGPTAVKIIDATRAAGADGIDATRLFEHAYRGRDGATVERLRSYVNFINDALKPSGVAIRLMSDRRRYRIVERRFA